MRPTLAGSLPDRAAAARTARCLLLCLWLGSPALLLPLRAAAPALRASDVVFMYQADRATYTAYGATVLAWGGKPTPASRAEAPGVRMFASVGMVTEFGAYHRRFPERYQEGLCRDVDGQPVKVPWLTDHQSQGVPYWWCCTRQPVFREFLRERVVEVVRAGAEGLHIDDHLGTAGGLWLGTCFCDRCVAEFPAFLAALPADERSRFGPKAGAGYDFREAVRQWLAEGPAGRQVTSHPCWPQWTRYQCRGAARFMQELRELAAATAGHPVPVGANAGLLWPRHLSDYQSLDLFSAETDHHAAERRFPDLPVLAYRMAEALDRPYAATASGQDWAFIKEHGRPGLVQGWIALGHAAGQRLMAPHRQWCYTQEKGTHWYEGPTAAFAPLYQFVRTNAACFDGFTTHADLTVVLPHGAFAKDTRPWFELAGQLARANLSYRLLLAGDDLVDHPLREADLAAARPLLVTFREELLPEDARRVQERMAAGGVYTAAGPALAAIQPAVRVEGAGALRVFPRTRPGAAVIHLVNYAYDFERDAVQPQDGLRVKVNPGRLGLSGPPRCRWLTPGAPERTLDWNPDGVKVPRLDLWGLLVLEAAASTPAP